jgi:catechol 2,3-dioxygenase-like lactoylglutathione lyase family enzyme
MKTIIAFMAGVALGATLYHPTVAQQSDTRALNHVGIVVENYDEAMRFYTEALGMREAYTVQRPDGAPLLTYLQLNRETFVELIPVTPQNPEPGISHFGMQVGDIHSAGTRHRLSGDLRGPDSEGRPDTGERRDRGRDADPALRQRTQSERALSSARARRGLSPRRRGPAALCAAAGTEF